MYELTLKEIMLAAGKAAIEKYGLESKNINIKFEINSKGGFKRTIITEQDSH
ncbi:hypothetical protein [Bacillus infantis]|uniref:hypothetical protein n=1 Tax=Bacillus infantis TaxID=324767 RepID=UPI003CEE0549